MSNVRVNESPNHFMVLDAISRGMKTVDKIAKVTKLSKPEVEMIVNDLVAQRLTIQTEKKSFFGGKKLEYSISHTGMQVLTSKKAELEKQARQVQQWYQNGNTAQLQGYMDTNRSWIPMMLFSGLMNAMFFMSMMSLMGMAMSPAESGFAGGADAGATADSGADGGGDAGDAGADGGGDFGGGDFGGGDFSF
ncbi:MAG TPA: helix-turn-helix domain-containing protein [Nitrososphaera sp.]|nr:helix-turn-helix domain-containing protein [Nitrososphaera sp.]